MTDMSKPKWHLKRAGFISYWNYDEEIFDFANGKMLIRGANGTGKSVTTQSLFPFLLDGKKSPERFDSFGSNARNIKDYLLGDEHSNTEEKTGYLFLEYRQKGTGKFITTGIGLQYKPGKNDLGFWGFVIWDSRRIGMDFLLYEKILNQGGEEVTIPLSRQKLEKRIGNGGEIVSGQKEYMALVNKHLFGFETLENYDGLIKLLIQLRGAKLSNDTKPTKIYDILTNALPELTNEDLATLSETIENMDQHKQDLEQYEGHQKALNAVCKQYDVYNLMIIAEKAKGFVKENRSLNKLKKERANLAEELGLKQKDQQGLKIKIEQLNSEEKALHNKLQSLEEHEATKVAKERQQFAADLNEVNDKIKGLKNKMEDKKRKERELQKIIKDIDEAILELEKNERDILSELDRIAMEVCFGNHKINMGHYGRNREEGQYSFTDWNSQEDKHLKRLKNILEHIRDHRLKQEEYNDVDKKINNLKQKRDNETEKKKRWETAVENKKDNLLQNFHQWEMHNEVLKFDDTDKKDFAVAVTNINTESDTENIPRIMNKVYRKHFGKITLRSSNLESMLNNIDVQMDEVTEELNHWQSIKDPEPPRHDDIKAARKYLTEKGIPFVPFYKAVEFRGNVTEVEKERIESAAAEMGLLDALIVPEKHINEVEKMDKIIKPAPKSPDKNLSKYLYSVPVEGVDVSAAEIEAVIMSVLVERKSGETYLLKDGGYQIGLLSGSAPKEKISQYIGQESRKKLKEAKIEELHQQWDQLSEKRKEVAVKRDQLKQAVKKLDYELSTGPTGKDIAKSYRDIEMVQKQIKFFEDEIAKLDSQLKVLWEKIKAIKNKLEQLSEDMDLERKEEVFATAIVEMDDYKKYLHQMEVNYNKLISQYETKQIHAENLDSIIEETNEIQGDINVLAPKSIDLAAKIKEFDSILKEMNAEEIKEEFEKAQNRLDELPSEREKNQDVLSNVHADIKIILDKAENVKTELLFSEKLHTAWQQTFINEAKFGLVRDMELDDDWNDEKAVLKQARDIINYSEKLDGKKENEIKDKLDAVFANEKANLVEYLPKRELVTGTEDPWELAAANDNFRLRVNELENKSTRVNLTFTQNEVSPYQVKEELDDKINDLNHLLNAEDKKLFEEVILRSVGDKIREKINNVEEWVENMNKLMAERGHMQLSIHWKPRAGETEEQMDTKDLVRQLRKKPDLMKEDDINRVIKHFKSKIEHAKRVYEDKNNFESVSTLHQIIKEILDYRHWFQFVLYYKKYDMSHRAELTNTAFSRLSGGEKAMSMYIPLFAAVHSKYSEAKSEAPNIIILDEAFAGVDDENIKDMFDLVEKLGFDYIMNSQALWGDYDTVPALSICELIRYKDKPDIVTVIPYYWNGRIREMVLPGISEQEGLFETGEN